MFRYVNRVRAFVTESRWMNFKSFSTTKITERHLAKGDALPPVDPSCMRLYRMRFCPYAHRTKLVLEHKKIPHETVFVHLKSKPDWLLERNPLGTVPVLEHKGNVVYESAVCDEFLEEAYPGPSTGTHSLLPSSPYERAAVRLLLLKFDKIFPSAFGIVKADDDAQRLEHLDTLQAQLEDLEQHMATTNKPFLGGSEYGMADLHFYPVFERLPAICNLGYDVVPADKFPRLVAWTSAVQQLDFVRKEWVSANLYCHFIASQKAGSPDYEMQMDEETIAMQNSVA